MAFTKKFENLPNPFTESDEKWEKWNNLPKVLESLNFSIFDCCQCSGNLILYLTVSDWQFKEYTGEWDPNSQYLQLSLQGTDLSPIWTGEGDDPLDVEPIII